MRIIELWKAKDQKRAVRVSGPVVADLHHLDEEQDPNSH
jgi:hypothetical protein